MGLGRGVCRLVGAKDGAEARWAGIGAGPGLGGRDRGGASLARLHAPCSTFLSPFLPPDPAPPCLSPLP